MDRCVRCGAELGVGRFCLNCGHPIGEPAPAPPEVAVAAPVAPDPDPDPEPDPDPHPDPQPDPEPEPDATDPAAQELLGLPVQAADPTAVPPAAPPEPEQDAPPAGPDPEPRPVSQWDPSEDLLPYEEAGDLEPDPLPGRAWIAWVVGAVLLVGLVFVLLQAFGTDGEEIATDPAANGSGTSDAGESPAPDPDDGAASPDEQTEATDGPTGVGKRLELATGGTFDVPDTAPPTTDFDGNLVAYEASQMNDGNLSTAWRMAGDATGQTVTLTLAEPGVVLRLGLVNGYSKQVAGVDWYPNNRRILAVTWTFEDGSTLEQTFAERPGLQMIKVPPVQTGTVAIQITSVTPPGSGNLGRDYTAISEVSVIGRRAG